MISKQTYDKYIEKGDKRHKPLRISRKQPRNLGIVKCQIYQHHHQHHIFQKRSEIGYHKKIAETAAIAHRVGNPYIKRERKHAQHDKRHKPR